MNLIASNRPRRRQFTRITGNIAVVQYRYSMARENYKKDRETVTGRYTDVLVKEGGRWLFILKIPPP